MAEIKILKDLYGAKSKSGLIFYKAKYTVLQGPSSGIFAIQDGGTQQKYNEMATHHSQRKCYIAINPLTYDVMFLFTNVYQYQGLHSGKERRKE